MPATIVEAIKAKTDPLCQTDCCCDSGCHVSLNGVPEPFVLINLEHDAGLFCKKGGAISNACN